MESVCLCEHEDKKKRVLTFFHNFAIAAADSPKGAIPSPLLVTAFFLRNKLNRDRDRSEQGAGRAARRAEQGAGACGSGARACRRLVLEPVLENLEQNPYPKAELVQCRPTHEAHLFTSV